MNRREFVEWLALLAAGKAAMPEMIEAYRHYYEVNTPQVNTGLIAIDEINVAGTDNRSNRVVFELLRFDKIEYSTALNAFGGVAWWKAAPDQKMVLPMREVRWNMFSMDDIPVQFSVHAHISFIDQIGKREYFRLLTPKGSLVALS